MYFLVDFKPMISCFLRFLFGTVKEGRSQLRSLAIYSDYHWLKGHNSDLQQKNINELVIVCIL